MVANAVKASSPAPAPGGSPPSEPTLRTLAPHLALVLSSVLAAGAALAQVRETAAEVERLRQHVDAHVASDGHPVTAEQVRALREDRASMEGELRELRKAVERIDRNVTVVCVNTPRAQCQHAP